jgi:endonuclease/exonuclease/phosphatase family metal-dependent hydrolase
MDRAPRWIFVVLTAGVLALLTGALSAAEPTVIRVVSYNIRLCGVGMDGKRDLARQAEVLRPLKPDIVLLQEVDRRSLRSGMVDGAKELGEALGLKHHFAKAIPLQLGDYGNAILTRYESAGDTRVVELSGGAERRVALLLPLRVPTATGEREVLIGCVHLDFRSDIEMEPNGVKLATLLATETRPIIFGGDINFRPGSRTVRALEVALTRLPMPPPAATYPADNPRVEIDHLFIRPASAWRSRECRVIPEALASDHRPVFAELELLPSPPQAR